MKKFLIVLSSLIGLFAILFVGYSVGGKVGREYGAQQYTKKMWANNEMQLSPYAIFQKVNEYRKQNNLQPFMLEDSLCVTANNEAKYAYEKSVTAWDQSQQQYGQDKQNAPDSPEAFGQRILNTCPNCDLNTYNYAAYVSLRPESCWNYQGKQVCEGNEGFGMLEKYTGRIAKLWSEDSTLKSTLQSPVKYGCVGAYGGSVILSVADLKK